MTCTKCGHWCNPSPRGDFYSCSQCFEVYVVGTSTSTGWTGTSAPGTVYIDSEDLTYGPAAPTPPRKCECPINTLLGKGCICGGV